mmetsp:Transcript_38711/g.121928  ORF Transcript_38711/g.121928 Transcript_38711/m.121928 type:complete len:220 (+) Transcript_38711:1283-1942(+)
MQFDRHLAEHFLDRLHVCVRRHSKRRVVVGYLRPRVRQPAEPLEEALGDGLQVGGEIPGHEADGEEGEADKEDADDEVEVLHRLHPEPLLNLRDDLQEEEPEEDVIDALNDPRGCQTSQHHHVHRDVAPRRVPQWLTMIQRPLASGGEPEPQHGVDKRREKEVEQRSGFRLHPMAEGKEEEDEGDLSHQLDHPSSRQLRRNLVRPSPQLHFALPLPHHS